MKKLMLGDISYALSKLGNISIFQYLTDDERKQLLDICEIFEYHKGEKIVSKGEVSSCFYAVLSGTLNVTVQDDAGKEIFLARIGEGEFFGEAGIFSDARRTADVSATDRV
jgi:CRP/FNR family cyclic AMP-dependent transcriptional regulator